MAATGCRRRSARRALQWLASDSCSAGRHAAPRQCGAGQGVRRAPDRRSACRPSRTEWRHRRRGPGSSAEPSGSSAPPIRRPVSAASGVHQLRVVLGFGEDADGAASRPACRFGQMRGTRRRRHRPAPPCPRWSARSDRRNSHRHRERRRTACPAPGRARPSSLASSARRLLPAACAALALIGCGVCRVEPRQFGRDQAQPELCIRRVEPGMGIGAVMVHGRAHVGVLCSVVRRHGRGPPLRHGRHDPLLASSP